MPGPSHHLRVVTATSLFDGHDAAINIMRRILQAAGVEVIHLGHDRPVQALVEAAVQEDAQAVAVTSYQGGHLEFFRYLRSQLDEAGATDVKIFGGGGGTILPEEAESLRAQGVERIYGPDEGRELGLQGMIDDLIARADAPRGVEVDVGLADLSATNKRAVARLISAAENAPERHAELLESVASAAAESSSLVVGITGTGGSGKSSLIDEIVLRFVADREDKSIAIISVDPSRRRSGGALLGDRIRMNSVHHPRVFMRSLATRQANLALSPHVSDALNIVKAAGFDLVILETAGIGQSDTEIVDHSDLSVYVMTPEYGAPSQLEKIDMLDFADLVAINKSDRRGALDALRDVRKQWRRNRVDFDRPDGDVPVYLTSASHFNDPGTNRFFLALLAEIDGRSSLDFRPHREFQVDRTEAGRIIPGNRVRYLAEIAETIREYNAHVERQADLAQELQGLITTADRTGLDLSEEIDSLRAALGAGTLRVLDEWDAMRERYQTEEVSYSVRNRLVTVEAATTTLSGTRVPKVAFPRMRGWGDRVRWMLQENVPGSFPYTGGVFPFRSTTERPTRMFAGEGGPEQTNRRFHYLSRGMPAARLSTAFDSVTLYGENPDERPDIYGKVGNSGVSLASPDDAKRLYSGFDLVDPSTSVSMTINGPAPMILAFFLNAAIDQQCERYIDEHGLWEVVEATLDDRYENRGVARPVYRAGLPEGNAGFGTRLLGISGDEVVPEEVYAEIRRDVLGRVRGTLQADILKEDQAQNTCIFSTEFALRMQGDIQQFFIDNAVRNFYSISISGYHIAEAGANPITQLAFTLANGFTFIEYFLARGMAVDDFARNLSFFFSNGVDAEYAVIGRVARRIWSKALRDRYGASDRSQKLKYHIQTSGRSLHAQEIGFNDIRTTLQALYAIYDSANSLHTNAYDEAITTPTEESVRRALAIQLIINEELGLNRNENPLQGSFVVEELTDLVEEAVLMEFDRISERGGVLEAMETQYQRSKIQEESLHYERLKSSGDLPIIGVNTFLSDDGSPFVRPEKIIRSAAEERDRLVAEMDQLHHRNEKQAAELLDELQRVALSGGNTFDALMAAAKVCSLGQMTHALYAVGGQYRRNM
ncbi:methylmalonyl-CoA mutase family protein [Candidatus Spongiisocius sp.]|uniref:methylmalonyl-CoA mutase family protein n=1 Tax=Candidatus Spongiisocius sp. TaxID=3101273 RepID=UPI003B5BB60C